MEEFLVPFAFCVLGIFIGFYLGWREYCRVKCHSCGRIFKENELLVDHEAQGKWPSIEVLNDRIRFFCPECACVLLNYPRE